MDSITNLLLNNKEEEKVEPKGRPQQKSLDLCFCLTAKIYFDIQEEQIFARIKSAIVLTPPFAQVINDKPDLYGPLWISSTLVFVIVASSSLILFLSDTAGTAYNFDKLSVAASLIYGIAFGCPYIIALLVKVFGGLVSVVDLICIYGYSLTVFLPVTAFCFINSSLIQLALLAFAFCFSTIFLIRGTLSLDRNLGDKQKGVLSIFIVGTQLLLVFMYKFYFFGLSSSS